ncbi:MAG TPA: class I SAM-dependent methyltransferase [Mycobacteriales bacterium]|nr:class I SAM-dependent methyltransferase [Mycobacteriales bacterium]
MTDSRGADAPGEHLNERAPLLLHSLAELASIWQPLFELAGVKTAIEVGSEAGFNTLPLARWLRGRGGGLTVVDPDPTDEVAAAAQDGELTAVRGLSPQALTDIPEADAYLLDGDHNYATLLSELETVFGPGAAPLVILHDVGWPWARRDLYYAPESLEAQKRHPYSYDLGVAPGRTDAFDGGFRGEGEFAVALTEGGPHNGVRTAVEDFVSVYDGFEFQIVPSVFGLGILYRSDAPYAEAVGAALEPYAGNPLLDRLERNRIELYLKVLELQDVLADRDAALERGRADLGAVHEQWQREVAERDADLATSRGTEAQMRRLFDSRESERSARELALLAQVADLQTALAQAERERDEARAAAAAPAPSRLREALGRLRG